MRVFLFLLFSWIMIQGQPSYANFYKSSTSLSKLSVQALPPDATVYPSIPCEGQTVYFFATGGTAYSWTGPNGFTSSLQNPVITNIQLANSGTYTVNITTTGGNVSLSVGVNVEMIHMPELPDITGCKGDIVNSINIPGGSYEDYIQWTNSNTAIGLGASGANVIPGFTMQNNTNAPITSTVSLTIKPKTVPTLPMSYNFADRLQTFSNIQLNGGTNYLETTPGAAVNMTGHLDITQVGNYCTGCIVQTYFGLGATNNSLFCFNYSNGYLPYSTNLNVNFNAPTQPGFYYMVFEGSLQYYCVPVSFVQDPNKAFALIKVEEAPISPNSSLSYDVADKHVDITNPKLNGGTNVVTVAPQSTVNLTYDYNIQQLNNNFCQANCGVQVYAGLGDGSNYTIDCISTFVPTSGSVNKFFTAPSEPGFYYILNQNSVDFFCQPQVYDNSPDNSIALLIVMPEEVCQPDTTEFTITVYPTLTMTATPASQTICSGNSISTIILSGNVTGTAYTWTRNNTANVTGIATSGNGNISGALTNNTNIPQLVTFTITPQSYLCPVTPITATVLVNPTPNAIASPNEQTICSGNLITPIILTGSVSGTTYSWSRDNTANVTGIPSTGTGNISGTLTNNTTSPQTVTFTIRPSANGCLGTTISATVLVNPTPNISAVPVSQTICSDNIITPIIVTGNIPGIAISWTRDHLSDVTGMASSGTGNITGWLINQTNSPITVTFTITSSLNNCSGNTLTATVLVNPTPIGTISLTPNPVCVGSDLQLSASGGSSYAWEGPHGWTSTQQNPVIAITSGFLQSGVYTVTITSGQGCSVVLKDTLKVNYPPEIDLTYEQNTACTGSDLKLHASGIGIIQWTGPNGWTSTEQDPVIQNATSANSGLYTLSITNSLGCTATKSVFIQINTPQPVVATPELTQVCEGGEVYLFASGSGTFQWSGPYTYASDMQNPVITSIPLYMTGIYTVKLTDENGCSSEDSVIVKVYPFINPHAYISADTVCAGQEVRLSADGGQYYYWVGPDGFYSNDQNPVISHATVNSSGTYTVHVYNEGKCYNYASVTLYVKPSIRASAWAIPNPVNEFDSVTFRCTPGVSYLWTGPNGWTSTEHYPTISIVTQNMAGMYFVQITNVNGCVSEARVYLQVKRRNNQITDNGDKPIASRPIPSHNVYPNPTGSFLYFDLTSPKPIMYSITDTKGQVITSMSQTTDNYISVENLNSGVYIIRWKSQDDEDWTVNRFVKIR